MYKFYLINRTVSSALQITKPRGINFACGGLTLPYNDSYCKSLLCQPTAKC